MRGGNRDVQLQSGLSAAQIRTQLERILASETFVRSERLSRFLRYVVEETLRGNGAGLKEQVIGHDLYGHDYDSYADPAVRVDARRLRDKLREYYAGATDDSVLIALPKGSYVPSFELNPAVRPALVPALKPIALPGKRLPWRKAAAAAGIVAATLAVVTAVSNNREHGIWVNGARSLPLAARTSWQPATLLELGSRQMARLTS